MSVRLRQIAVTMLAALLGLSWSAAALHTHSHDHDSAHQHAGHVHIGHVHAGHQGGHQGGAANCCLHQHAHAGHSHAGHPHAGIAETCDQDLPCDAPQPEHRHDGCVICEFLAQPPLPTSAVVLPALTETVQGAVVPARPSVARLFVSLFESRGPPVA